MCIRDRKTGGEAVCLIKPQFEAGREKVGKKGVVRDPAIHLEVIEHILAFAESVGFTLLGLTYSPVKGPEGNIEYLLYMRKQKEPCTAPALASIEAAEVVAAAHRSLNA